MKDADGKKVHILSAKDLAAQAMLRATPATLADLQPIQETLLNIGAGLHGIAALLEDYGSRITAMEDLLAHMNEAIRVDNTNTVPEEAPE